MNQNTIPQLSDNIIYYPINQNEFFIHQTIFDHRVKISLELYHFLKMIDNKNNLETIVNQYNKNYNSNLTVTFATDFLYHKLARYGIVQSDDIDIIPNDKPSYLKLSFIVIKEQTVAKFTKYLKFLFLPHVMIKTIILFSVVLLACFHQYYNQIFFAGIEKSQWLLLLSLAFIGVTFHEFGHASAAHYFGAKHGGIGGGFYLFMPVYFADVTDIWRLQKRQRIIVNLAGMYFEFIYATVLILIGLIVTNNLIIILACIYALSILRNLNPFIRSDGYWVLSDALEKPNLMHHGFDRIKNVFKSKKYWRKIDYFLMVYGLISYSFIMLFLYFVVVKNPNSILYFPQNLYQFAKNVITSNNEVSLAALGKLFIPLLFYYLLFNWFKKLFLRYVKK